MAPEIHVFKHLRALHDFAAERMQSSAEAALRSRQRFLLVLSGGSTPKGLFERLAQPPYRKGFPWNQTHVFWADERLVPADSRASNFGQAQRLLFSQVEIPKANLHPIAGDLPAQASAASYDKTLRRFGSAGSGYPRFDLVLLGMGQDGHTASLFPGPIQPQEQQQAVLAVHAHYADRPSERITLTPWILNQARQVYFMVVGETKADALAAVLQGESDPAQWPAQRIQPRKGQLSWLVDEAAAAQLS